MGKKVTETITMRGALIMPYPSALGPADEPLTIEWPEGHPYAVVATAFHGGAVLGTMATKDEAWEIYDQWPKTDCRCGCRGIITRDGLRLRRGGSPQKILGNGPSQGTETSSGATQHHLGWRPSIVNYCFRGQQRQST